MHFIPYVMPQAQAAAPAAVQNRLQAPTVDTRAIQQGLGQLAQAGQQAEIPMDPQLAPGRGMQQAGEGISQIGTMLEKIAMVTAKANAERMVGEATNRLDMGYASELSRMMTMDPNDRLEHWQAVSGQLMKAEMDRENLPPIVRQRLELYGKEWQGKTSVDVMTGVRKDIFEGARAATKATIMRQIDRGNFGAAEAGKEHLLKNQYGNAADAYEIDAAIAQKKKQDRMNREYDAIGADPRAWMAENKERPKDDPDHPENNLSAAEHDRLVSHARQEDRVNVGNDQDRLENAIADGTIKVPAEVDEWEKDNPRLTPRIREMAKAHVFRMTDAIEKEKARANAPENSSKLLSELASLDPEKATDEQLASLRQRIAELPEGYRELPYSRFIRKWRSHEEGQEAPKSLLEMGDDILDDYLKAGLFGSFDFGPDDDGWRTTPWDVLAKADATNAKHAALAAKSKVGGELNRWIQGNPKATEEDVRKRIIELVPEAKRAGLLDLFDSPAPAPDQAAIDAENERRAKAAKGKSTKQREREEAGPSSNVATAYSEAPLPGDPTPVEEEDGNLLLDAPQ